MLEEVAKEAIENFQRAFSSTSRIHSLKYITPAPIFGSTIFVGVVQNYDKATKIATIEQRNRMYKGEEIEVVNPKGDFLFKNRMDENADGEEDRCCSPSSNDCIYAYERKLRNIRYFVEVGVGGY